MAVSKAWEWGKVTHPIWLEPSEESYYIAERWRRAEYADLLDLGCGLGRHSIFFAKSGFKVSAFDLSAEGVEHLAGWAQREHLDIDARVSDMLELPYPDGAFDCLFAYHVISHTDTEGVRRIFGEIKRVLRPGGELYITLCSKESWNFAEAGFPRLDQNTIIKTEAGPEQDIPHFYAGMDDALALMADSGLEPVNIRHVDDCYFDDGKRNSKHYFILGRT